MVKIFQPVIETQERHEKSPKKGQVVRLDVDSRSDSLYVRIPHAVNRL